MSMKKSHTGLLAHIRGLASRPEGLGYADGAVNGISMRQLVNNGRHMALAGELLIVGYRHQRRYFSHAEDAQRYEVELAQIKAQPRKKKAAKPKPPKPPKAAKQTPWRAQSPAKGKDAKEAPVRIAAPKVPFKDMEPIVPAGVKVKVIPSPEHFGAAARLAYAPPPSRLVELRVGKEI